MSVTPQHILAVCEVVRHTGLSAHDRRAEYGHVSQVVWAVAIADGKIVPRDLQEAVEATADLQDAGMPPAEAREHVCNIGAWNLAVQSAEDAEREADCAINGWHEGGR